MTEDKTYRCPPCPTKALLDFANDKNKELETENKLEKSKTDYWRIRFFILCGVILLGIAFKFRKFLGVPF